jgi:hypothetical protein
MKNLKSTKPRVTLSLAFLIVLFGGLIPTLGAFSGGKQSAHASTGWQLQELWHNSINIPTGSYSYPGVSDIIYSSGKVYETLGFHDLYYGGDTSITDGFDSSTGSQVWQKRAGDANSTPLIANGKIYFANQSQQLHVYDATDDQLPELWHGNSTTATLENGILYSHSGNAWVQQPAGYYSYDANTGQTNWQQTDTTCDLYPKIEIYNSIVYYIGCEINPSLYSSIYYTIEARNATDGNLLWSKTPQYVNTDSTGYPIPPAPSYNSTLISNGYIFIAATNKVISYNATDGTQTWEKTLSDTPLPTGTRASIGQIIASGSTVYVLVNIYQGSGGQLNMTAEDIYALDAATGNEIWHNSTRVNTIIYNSRGWPYGTLVNGVLYFNYSSAIYAWDAATGNQLMMDDSVATSPTNPSISTPLIVGNTMYITREDVNTQLYTIYAYNIIGQHIIVNPTQGQPGTAVTVTGSSWTPGDVVDISLSPSVSVLTKATVAGDGTFSTTFTVPENAATGSQFVNAKDETTSQTAQAPFTVTRKRLFILLQGINSQLTATDIQNNPTGTTLGSVGSTLENAFQDAQFLEYSYAGSQTDGTPQPYLCGPTFTNPILKDIQLLNTQIAHAIGNNQSTDIYLIGHSLGGVVAFGYLALLEDHLNGVSLPSGAQLKAVVTLDSPLGGVRGGRYEYFSKYIATNYLIPFSKTKVIPKYPCDGLVGTKTPLTAVDDLVKIYNSSSNGGTTLPDDPGNDPLGAQASIEAISGVTLPPQRPFLPTNDFQALSAHTDLGTSVLSVGNTGDYLWNPAPCSLLFVRLSKALAAIVGTIPGFTDTQFLEDQGNSSGLYGRFFNTAQFCDAATLTHGLNHGDVLINANVLKGLVHFLAPVGTTPDPLAINPYQP